MAQLRIVIVDGHPLMLQGIESAFYRENDFLVVGVGQCADDAVRLACEAKPDILILDASIPGGALHATRRIRSNSPSSRVIIFSSSGDPTLVMPAMDAGAAGYILKKIGASDLVRAVRSVAIGETHIAPEFAGRLLALNRRADLDEKARLSQREQSILGWLASGKTNKEIACQLGVSEKTIKNNMSELLQKLGVRNRMQAMIASGGLIESPLPPAPTEPLSLTRRAPARPMPALTYK